MVVERADTEKHIVKSFLQPIKLQIFLQSMVKDIIKHEISDKFCTQIRPTVQGTRGLQIYFLQFNSKNKLREKTPG